MYTNQCCLHSSQECYTYSISKGLGRAASEQQDIPPCHPGKKLDLRLSPAIAWGISLQCHLTSHLVRKRSSAAQTRFLTTVGITCSITSKSHGTFKHEDFNYFPELGRMKWFSAHSKYMEVLFNLWGLKWSSHFKLGFTCRGDSGRAK